MAKNRKSSDEQYTKEATFGTLPVRRSERQYGMLDIPRAQRVWRSYLVLYTGNFSGGLL